MNCCGQTDEEASVGAKKFDRIFAGTSYWILLILAAATVSVYESVTFQPSCNELNAVMTTNNCSYQFGNVTVYRDAYRNVKKGEWVCPEQCSFDADGTSVFDPNHENVVIKYCDRLCDKMTTLGAVAFALVIYTTMGMCLHVYYRIKDIESADANIT